MRINEKNLCAFAVSGGAVDREGWLCKRGEVNKGYQRRWFVLKGNLLFYFDKKGDKEPIGVIILEGCTVELAEDDDQYSFKIMFHGSQGRAYVLAAESQEAMERWMKALACASYDYMKLMVAELQRQLDEIEEMNTAQQTENVNTPKAPPRGQRYNPFNKVQETRGQSSRSGKGERAPENVPRTKISFRELHTLYGRKILSDYNEWRHKKQHESSTPQDGPLHDQPTPTPAPTTEEALIQL